MKDIFRLSTVIAVLMVVFTSLPLKAEMFYSGFRKIDGAQNDNSCAITKGELNKLDKQVRQNPNGGPVMEMPKCDKNLEHLACTTFGNRSYCACLPNDFEDDGVLPEDLTKAPGSVGGNNSIKFVFSNGAPTGAVDVRNVGHGECPAGKKIGTWHSSDDRGNRFEGDVCAD